MIIVHVAFYIHKSAREKQDGTNSTSEKNQQGGFVRIRDLIRDRIFLHTIEHSIIRGCDVEIDEETHQPTFCWTHLVHLTSTGETKVVENRI